MIRRAAPALLLLLAVAATGCSKFVLDARSMDNVVSMTKAGAGAADQPVPFRVSAKAAYLGLAFNLVTLSQPNVPTILKQEINSRRGTAIRNLKIDKRRSFTDGLISLVTLGIYNQETITFEGEVVK